MNTETRDQMTFGELLQILTPRTPIYLIIIVMNCAVFAVMVATGVDWIRPNIDDLVKWGANTGPRTVKGEEWRLLSCTFIHGGLLHLGVNMWGLRNIGWLVERLVGPVGFLILYILSGLGGSICSLAYSPFNISVGASGALYGIVGAMFAVILRQKRWFPAQVIAQTRKNAVIFVVVNTGIAFSVPHIDIAAHIGGAVVGFLCGLVLGHPLRPDAVRGRRLRNLVLAIGGALIICGAFIVVKQQVLPQINLQEELHNLQEELRSIGTLDVELEFKEREIFTAHDERRIDDAKTLARIENELLLPWREMRQRMNAVTRMPEGYKLTLAKFQDYLRLREERWELYCRFLREKELALLELAKEKQRQAEEIMNGK